MEWSVELRFPSYHHHHRQGKFRITASNTVSAYTTVSTPSHIHDRTQLTAALAGNALKKHGTNPLQYPLTPPSLHTARAASRHLPNFLPSPSSSVMYLFLTTSEG